MTIKIEAPHMGESISEATVAKWLKKEGEFVNEDELLAELETDKVNLEVTAPHAGKLMKIMTGEGDTVSPGDAMGEIDEAAEGEAKSEEKSADSEKKEEESSASTGDAAEKSGPAVRKMVAESGVDTSQIKGSGKDGRLTKEDVSKAQSGGGQTAAKNEAGTPSKPAQPTPTGERHEERVPMSRLRKTIATRLKQAQNTSAMLTTYNEVDMSAIMELRKQYKDSFTDKHGVKLGFMSFFTKAVIEALKDWPALNASIEGEEIVYHHYYDIGIAVSTERGLVVPVLRNADQMSFADIEQAINDFGQRARSGKITPDELSGGTFTITNGGIFGSMMSMPILNTPQSGILGMHAIKERPVAINGEVTVRPMMYLAMTYDHRLVDGRESVSFLYKIKECLEDPQRLLLSI